MSAPRPGSGPDLHEIFGMDDGGGGEDELPVIVTDAELRR